MRLMALILVLVACGGTGGTLPDPGRPFTEEEVYPSVTTRQIDQLRWHNETLTFYEAAPDTVMLDVEGPLLEPEVREAMNATLPWPLTPAELWLALSGQDVAELPDVLAADHLRYVEADERPSADYQRAVVPTEVLTEKAVDPNRLFAPVTALPSGHCWAHSVVAPVRTLRLGGSPNSYACSSPTADTDFGVVFFQTAATNEAGVSCPHKVKNVRVHVGGYLDRILVSGAATNSPIKRYTCSSFTDHNFCAPENQAVVDHYSFNEILPPFATLSAVLGYRNDFTTGGYQVTFGTAIEAVGVPAFGRGGRCN